MEENFKMVAKTLFGFEEILAKELKKLGAQKVKEGVRNVSFYGDLGFMYKANLALRTAIKILKPIDSFRVMGEDDLYDQIKRMGWEDYMEVEGTLAVDATIHSEAFTNSLYVAQKTKDAIVDRFREKFGKRPDVDLSSPDIRINIHIDRERCTVSLDSSGESLHKRGYKLSTNIAPINEVLAAGLVLLSDWDQKSNFLDPMCGSGTLLIEATMIACNIPPNIKREEFAFEKWKDWDPEMFDLIRNSLINKIKDFPRKIMGYDKAPSAVDKARENIKNAELEDYITIEQKDFFKTKKTIEGPLYLLFNPPYGERLEIDVEWFYKEIGDTLKQGYPGTIAWFITSNLEGLKYVGLRPSRKIHLFNAKLESRLVKYEMYEGSKKAKFNNYDE